MSLGYSLNRLSDGANRRAVDLRRRNQVHAVTAEATAEIRSSTNCHQVLREILVIFISLHNFSDKVAHSNELISS